MKGIRRLLVLQHLEIEGPGLFEQFAKERNLKIEIIRLDNKNALPQTKNGDLILIMGGPMGVKDIGSDKYPWLKLERDFIKKELENVIFEAINNQTKRDQFGKNARQLFIKKFASDKVLRKFMAAVRNSS